MAGLKPMALYYSMGITQFVSGVGGVKSTANLQMLLGNMGVPGGGVNPLRGQNNVQGACDMGCLPATYPAYQSCPESRRTKRNSRPCGAFSACRRDPWAHPGGNDECGPCRRCKGAIYNGREPGAFGPGPGNTSSRPWNTSICWWSRICFSLRLRSMPTRFSLPAPFSKKRGPLPIRRGGSSPCTRSFRGGATRETTGG